MSHLKAKFSKTLDKINRKIKGHRDRITIRKGGNAVAKGLSQIPVPDMTSSGMPGEASQLYRSPEAGSATTLSRTSSYEAGMVHSKQNPAMFELMQPAALPLGGFVEPVARPGNSNSSDAASPAGAVNIFSQTSSFPRTYPQGQKRIWAEPSPLDHWDVDYAAGQKSKMYTSLSAHPGDLLPSSLPAARPHLESPKFESLQYGPPAGRSRPDNGSHTRCTAYITDDDLASFTERILATKCNACSRLFYSSVGDIITKIRNMLECRVPIHPYQTCVQCRTIACLACGAQRGQPVDDLQLSGRKSVCESSKQWCCDGGRLFIFWALCCGPDHSKIEPSNCSVSWGKLKGKLKGSKSEPKPGSPAPAGKAKEQSTRALSKGVGYGSDDGSSSAMGLKWTFALAGDNSKSSKEEKLLTAYFGLLGTFLLTFRSNKQLAPRDNNPPPMVRLMLRRSPLLMKAVELLRIDSIEAMSMHVEMYKLLLRFIAIIGSCPVTSAIVYEEHIIYAPEEQLGHFWTSKAGIAGGSTNGGRPNHRGKAKQPDRGSPIVKIVENLAVQCRHLNKVASCHMDELTAEESSQMLDLSRTICDLAAEYEQNRSLGVDNSNPATCEPSTPTQASLNVLTRSKEIEKAREDFSTLHRNACVTEVPDEELLRNFKFTDHAAGIDAMTTAKNRMKKIVAQVANLRTSLPEGIWVKHGESRLDVMKILMIGPKGTPYEHGLFEFDLFCPAQFPLAPPMMFFRTTGGGTIRFNPNLYEDGKVCLSILGTWSGENWNASYSTLLQVLVSIYGMIFVEQPWYNEPGRERRPDKTASKNYNLAVQAYTMEFAIANWLDERLSSVNKPVNGPAGESSMTVSASGIGPTQEVIEKEDDPIWGEIIRKHFAANGKAIFDMAQKKSRLTKEEVGKLRDALAQRGYI